MSNIKTFLKVLNKVGYPNPDVLSVANMVSYDLDDFLPDLVDEIGEDKANWFVGETFSKLSTKDGIRLDLTGDDGEYVYIIIHKSHIDLDNSHDTVLIDWSWGPTKLLVFDEDGGESYQTMEEISEQVDMGEWADYDVMVDSIKDQFQEFIYNRCGFGVWWDIQI